MIKKVIDQLSKLVKKAIPTFGSIGSDFIAHFGIRAMEGKRGSGKRAANNFGEVAADVVFKHFTGETSIEAFVLMCTDHFSEKKWKRMLRFFGNYGTDWRDKMEIAIGNIWQACENGITYMVLENYQTPAGRTGTKSYAKQAGDPLELFFGALNRIFHERATNEHIKLGLELFHQASWREKFMRFMDRLSLRTAKKSSRRKLLWILTFTKPRKVLVPTLSTKAKSAFRQRMETKQEVTKRAWKRVFLAIFLLLVLLFVIGVIGAGIIGAVLVYQLIFGSVAAQAGVSGLLISAGLMLAILAVLPVVVSLFAGTLGSWTWKGWFAFLFNITGVGLLLGLLSQIVDLGAYPVLASITIVPVAVFLMGSGYRWITKPHLGDRGFEKDDDRKPEFDQHPWVPRLMSVVAAVLIVVGLVGMFSIDKFLLERPKTPIEWTVSMWETGYRVAGHFNTEASVSTLTGKVKECRPIVPRRVVDASGKVVLIKDDVWPFGVPEGFPDAAMKYGCDPENPGKEPLTGLPGVPLEGGEKVLYFQWKAKRPPTSPRTKTPSQPAATRKATPAAPSGSLPSRVIPTGPSPAKGEWCFVWKLPDDGGSDWLYLDTLEFNSRKFRASIKSQAWQRRAAFDATWVEGLDAYTGTFHELGSATGSIRLPRPSADGLIRGSVTFRKNTTGDVFVFPGPCPEKVHQYL